MRTWVPGPEGTRHFSISLYGPEILKYPATTSWPDSLLHFFGNEFGQIFMDQKFKVGQDPGFEKVGATIGDALHDVHELLRVRTGQVGRVPYDLEGAQGPFTRLDLLLDEGHYNNRVHIMG